MKVTKDVDTIEDAGLDNYLNRTDWLPANIYDSTSRSVGAGFLAGGQLGSDTVIELGSGLIKIDGANKRILINDGANDRILLGFQSQGF